MKTFTILLFLALSVKANAQAPLHSDKYAVQLETSSFDANTAPKFERMLEEDIASIQLVTLFPQQVGDSLCDSTGAMVPGRVFRFESIFNDSVVRVELIKSRKTLDHTDVDAFVELLYANIEKSSSETFQSPRHGILYMDQLGNHLGFIEICFECDYFKATTNTFIKGLSSEHYQKLNALFRKYLGDEMSVYDTRG